MGLIKRVDKGVFELTKSGKKIMKLKSKERRLAFVTCIVSHQIFHSALKESFENATPIGKEDVINIINRFGIRNAKSKKTIDRRAQSVVKWIEWILDLLEEDI